MKGPTLIEYEKLNLWAYIEKCVLLNIPLGYKNVELFQVQYHCPAIVTGIKSQ